MRISDGISRFHRHGVSVLTGLAAGVLGLVVAGVIASASLRDRATADEIKPPAAAKATGKLPVVLLTGFEPFGKKKPPNPSWEAIKKLDGREWKGFRLVAKQLPVVWGSPLTQLEGWIAELKPVAVISLGQGGEGGFSIESWAYNRRSDEAEDNLKNKAPVADVVTNGPKRFDATIDSLKLAKALAEKGYNVNVSTNAGRYLCEETLYCLEYLKAARKIDGPVLFCHVPPLGSKLTKTKFVTEDYVEHFAEDLLETWHDAYQNPQAPAAAPAPAAQGSSTAPAREQEVKAFIEHYFKCWSDQDMDAYDDCFMSDACIQYIDAHGQLFTSQRQRFVASQREVHRRSTTRSVEVPESIEIRFEQKLARVVAYWRLNSGTRVQKGYDHFTLKQERGKWRIVNLLFYATSDNGQD
jgi:pyroglutamyl-peptidase